MILVFIFIISIMPCVYAAEMKINAGLERSSVVDGKPVPLHVHNLSRDLSSSSESLSPIITPTPAIIFTALDKRLVKTPHGLQQFLTQLAESQFGFCTAVDAWEKNEPLPEQTLHNSTVKLEMAQDLMRDIASKSTNRPQLNRIRRTAHAIAQLASKKTIQEDAGEAKKSISRKAGFGVKSISDSIGLEGTELKQYNAVQALLDDKKLEPEEVLVNIGTDLDGIFVLLNAIKIKTEDKKYLDAIQSRAADIACLAETGSGDR
ncbi:MAG TPA: hypothetical protein VFF04_05165 [Candidatus Babeliales bacterium]|nr:hypothetical protein [Candidatus Babeliales bacterium]